MVIGLLFFCGVNKQYTRKLEGEGHIRKFASLNTRVCREAE
jgi:hypothetical protein